MAKIAKNQTQDKLASILAEYPKLLALILKGENLQHVETILTYGKTDNFVSNTAIREISKIIKLGSKRELTRADLYAAYCLGKVEALNDYLSRLEVIIQNMRSKIDEEGI